MNKIEFNKNYTKLHNQTRGYLIWVGLTDAFLLEKEFIEYDTDSKESIPDGRYLLLVFIGNKDIPFTTLRKANPENIEKYDKGIRKVWEIIIKK